MSGLVLHAILPALCSLSKAELHPVLWGYLLRNSRLRPGCLPWNSGEENVFNLVPSLCLPVLSPALVKH